MDIWLSKFSVVVACFLPVRAKDLSAPLCVLGLLRSKRHGWILKRTERCPIKLGPVRRHSMSPPLDVAAHTSGRAGRLAGRRLARIQADNKITILFSVSKLGNKSKFNKFVFWFQTSAVFWMLYAFFWVIPRPLNFISQHFRILCFFHLPTFPNTLSVPSS